MTISKSPSPYEISRPVIEISVNDIGVGYNSREIVYQRVFSILLFLFVPIFSISPYPSPPFIFCTLLDSSLGIKYTQKFNSILGCRYSLSQPISFSVDTADLSIPDFLFDSAKSKRVRAVNCSAVQEPAS